MQMNVWIPLMASWPESEPLTHFDQNKNPLVKLAFFLYMFLYVCNNVLSTLKSTLDFEFFIWTHTKIATIKNYALVYYSTGVNPGGVGMGVCLPHF